ncbi:phospholipid scramblase 1-like [Gigantopelta aegis]|uniref:phospholipid scramblase 1-like n=1 Tax=Gigantopelta aegis TaxID=1735272 RepID=UPI001B88C215|nr:phospholipid scramblase 1-like [Gigantopelta aegis]
MSVAPEKSPKKGHGHRYSSHPPPGLEYLAQVDQLLVHQTTELLEAVLGFETNNKYVIKNSLGQQVYFAAEDTDCFTRNICGRYRPFNMTIVDNSKREVIHLYRPLRCSSWMFPCCLQKIAVESPPGQIIGYVCQGWYVIFPHFYIQDENYNSILRIKGPLCPCSFCGDVKYNLTTMEGAIIGKITKQWSGILKEALTDAENFGVTFPVDLDVRTKAIVLAAVFLLDFMFFEDGPGDKDKKLSLFST